MKDTAHKDLIEAMAKINDKVFTLISSIPGKFVEAVCPQGRRCWIDFKGCKIMHRDCSGRVQCEPFVNY